MSKVSDRPLSSSAMPYPPGTVLAEKYCVERLLGEGGMGWVVVAMHMQLEQRVALKFMRESHADGRPEAVGRFLREARAAARIQSEHVARVTDVGTLTEGVPYLVMEYLQGQDLDALLAAQGALSAALAVNYAMQACEGLAEAHAVGIVHRDLKPANLFLARRKDGSVRVKLLDFGISKLTETQGRAAEAGMTSTQTLMGSPLYMAPEQMRSAKSADLRADIWSMGIILYEMLGGVSPFDGETLPVVCARIMTEQPASLRSTKPSVPRGLESVIMRCLEKDPARRFPSVASLADALAPFGGAAARAGADRIARIAIDRDEAAESARSEAKASGAVASLSGGAAARMTKTSASFATVRPAATHVRRPRTLPLALGGGAVLAGALMLVGFLMATRPPQRVAAAGVVPIGPSSVAVVPAPVATLASEAASSAKSPPAVPSVPAPSTRPSAARAAGASVAGAAGTRSPQSRVKSGPTSSAKPSGTTAFGGRD